MKQKRGFTIIELMVALVIILTTLIAVSQVVSGAHRGGTATKQRLIALRIARNVIDQVRSLPLGASVPNPVPSDWIGPLAGESVEGKLVGLEFSIEKIDVNIPPPAAGSQTLAGFGNVTVTVAWHQSGGNTNSAGNNSLQLTGGLSREP